MLIAAAPLAVWCPRSQTRAFLAPADHLVRALRDLALLERVVPARVDDRHRREDPADEVGAAGRYVLVGRGEQRTQRELDRLVAGHVLAPCGLDPVPSVDTPRPGR